MTSVSILPPLTLQEKQRAHELTNDLLRQLPERDIAMRAECAAILLAAILYDAGVQNAVDPEAAAGKLLAAIVDRVGPITQEMAATLRSISSE